MMLQELCRAAESEALSALAAAIVAAQAPEAVKELRAKRKELAAQLPGLEANVAEAEAELGRRLEALTALRQELATLPDARNWTREATRRKQALDLQIAQAHDAVETYRGQPDRARRILAEAQDAIAALDAEIAALEAVTLEPHKAALATLAQALAR